MPSPPEMSSTMMAEIGGFRSVPQERSFVSCSGTYQQILDSIVRQEATLMNLTEDHVLLQSAMQRHHEAVCGRLDRLQNQAVSSAYHSADEGHNSEAAHLIIQPTCHGPTQMPIIKEFVSESSQMSADKVELEPKLKVQPASPMNVVAVAKAIKRQETASAQKEIAERHSAEEAVIHWLVLHVREFFSSTKFDLIMGAMIFLNLFILAVHLQFEGMYAAHMLGLRRDDGGWLTVKVAFEAMEKVFNAIYLMELIVRVYVFGLAFFNHAFNIMDAVIVVITCVDSFIVQPIQQGMGGMNFAVLRIFRICRIFRIQKVMRFTQHMGEMRIIVETLVASLMPMSWAAMLIAAAITSSGVLMVQLCHAFLDDESIPIERRRWLADMFGTTTSACYTMFESTFSSRWHSYSRPMIEEVSYGFALFWIVYIFGVNFSMLRVVGAIFLKQIMYVANLDEKREVMMKDRERERVASELRELFEVADTSKNGAISRHEFDQMLQDPKVLNYIEKIGLEIEDAVALFSMMSLDDGEADYAEFLDGAINMKSAARAIDVVQVLHRQMEMHNQLVSVLETVSKATVAVT